MTDYRTNNYPNSCRMEHNRITPASNPRPNTPVQPVPCKKDLMTRINQYSFAVNEANLFLDTHPYDTEALNYFQKYRKLRVEAIKEYDKHYAPLVIDCTKCDKTPWSWAKEPWPWEGVDC